jgi:PilZ domain-containing protein
MSNSFRQQNCHESCEPIDPCKREGPMRRFPRFSHSMLVNMTTNNTTHTGRTIDVSERGARVATREPLAVGMKLDLELYLQETDPFPIRLQGQCRWSRSENNESVSGIDLTPSRTHSLRVLRAYIQQD